MKLPFAFCRLPLRVDIERLAYEVAQFGEQDWRRHPSGFEGNSALRLISVDGGENDDFAGVMAPTPHLSRCPYIRQILETFGVAWSRSRLMRLGPGATVPEHCDVNLHWVHRVRLHIPVKTSPAVSFRCADQTVHMGAGEVWLFDNWRMHEVRNDSGSDRIHLVADTCGSAAFWNMVGAGQVSGFERRPDKPAQLIPYRAGVEARPLLERCNVTPVMHPAEVEMLSYDLLNDLRLPAEGAERAAHQRFGMMVTTFCREWRMLWSLFGDREDGWPHFRKLRDWAIRENGQQSRDVVCASNGMAAVEVFHPRVLLYALFLPAQPAPVDLDRTVTRQDGSEAAAASKAASRRISLDRPTFIVAAPRSGSSALFETLAQAKGLWTVGGESHWLVERIPQLQPWAAGVGSNRLTAAQVDDRIRAAIIEGLIDQLRDRDQRRPDSGAVRVLEKTPKHALRIPFFNAIFPDARFIFLWRDPRENISSIIEAWRSGQWVTYPQLSGWGGAWSLLLPPGWEAMRGKPLEEIAAFQWAVTNRTVMDDLMTLPRDRWTSIRYHDFVADPRGEIERLCRFADIELDDHLRAYLERPLPPSAHTLTVPAAEKWRANAGLIERVLPQVGDIAARLAAL